MATVIPARLLRYAFQVGLLVSPGSGLAMIDLDGDRASELWESRYSGVSADETDSDKDGFSNFDEMVAGTDPLDPSSFLDLLLPDVGEFEFELRWDGVAGKAYTVETWSEEGSLWEPVLQLNPSIMDGERTVSIPRSDARGFYRISVGDVDGDLDGLSAWEEALLGWSDQDMFGSGNLEVPDFEMAVRLLESGEGLVLAGGEVLPQRLPSANEASRFLVQASFGPTPESIEEVVGKGITGWLADQLELSPTLTISEMFKTSQPQSAALWRHGWWRTVLIADDQLRQRMAYALSQIFVVNTESGSVIGDNPLTQASYYDILIKGAFGEYRDVLEDVTYSPSMGFYLSHLNNRKSDPATNRFPDENFAREIMQLFSIGLWKLNPDGSHAKDIEGNSIPTYDNEVITEMAKIFTGMSHGTTRGGAQATSFYDVANGNDYRFPMKVWDEEHEPGPKTLFDGIVIPDGQTGEEDVQQTLDALAAHDSLAPFFSRLLIQRFTSSNPSPDYLFRVSTVWNASGGDFERVLKAILFDPEARTLDSGPGKRGKVREPLIRLIQLLRAFEPDEAGPYAVLFNSLKSDLGQFAMSSPTVFNFYLPDFSPAGMLRSEGLVAPELQIATASSLLATHDRLKNTANAGHWIRGVDYSEEEALLGDTDGLIDHLDTLLTYGTMSETTRLEVRHWLEDGTISHDKIYRAVHKIVTSPEYSVLK